MMLRLVGVRRRGSSVPDLGRNERLGPDNAWNNPLVHFLVSPPIWKERQTVLRRRLWVQKSTDPKSF
jgi:hypothetical protein